MVTYCPEEEILFSSDAFGQHYCCSKRFDDETEVRTCSMKRSATMPTS